MHYRCRNFATRVPVRFVSKGDWIVDGNFPIDVACVFFGVSNVVGRPEPARAWFLDATTTIGFDDNTLDRFAGFIGYFDDQLRRFGWKLNRVFLFVRLRFLCCSSRENEQDKHNAPRATKHMSSPVRFLAIEKDGVPELRASGGSDDFSLRKSIRFGVKRVVGWETVGKFVFGQQSVSEADAPS